MGLTKTTTTTEIVHTVDGRGPCHALVSLVLVPKVKAGPGVVKLVVGAQWANHRCAHFTKAGLQDLVNELQSVCDCL